MLLPATAATGVTQDRISLPSSSTEQAPHCARPQPKRGPCRWSSLCRTYRSGVSRLAFTPCVSPLTLILTLLAIRASRIGKYGTATAQVSSPRTADRGTVAPLPAVGNSHRWLTQAEFVGSGQAGRDGRGTVSGCPVRC